MLVQHRKQRKARLTVGASWKTFKDDGAGERTVLFWSGGKDSFLTLRALQQRNKNKRKSEGPERITLLTTFDGKTGKIPFQDTKVRVVAGSVAVLSASERVADALLPVVHLAPHDLGLRQFDFPLTPREPSVHVSHVLPESPIW